MYLKQTCIKRLPLICKHKQGFVRLIRVAASDLERLKIKVERGLLNTGFTGVERLELLETTSKFRTSHEISSSYVHFLHKTWQKEN